MNGETKTRVSKLKERAAARSLGLRPAPEPPYGWELDNAFNVVAHGTLDDIERWLTRTDPGRS